MQSHIQTLKDRNEYLEELLGLKNDIDPKGIKRLKLTQTQYKLLCILLKSKLANHRFLVEAMYGDDISGGPEDAPQTISVHIHHLRRKLKVHGITISTLWGQGFYLDDTSKATTRRLLGMDVSK